MFGRAKRALENQLQATKEKEERNRRAYAWKRKFDEAKGDEQETTRVFVAYQIDQVFIRLQELEERSADEMGEQARMTRKWLLLIVTIFILGHFWH